MAATLLDFLEYCEGRTVVHAMIFPELLVDHLAAPNVLPF